MTSVRLFYIFIILTFMLVATGKVTPARLVRAPVPGVGPVFRESQVRKWRHGDMILHV